MGLDVKVLRSQLPAPPPGPCVTEEERGAGILADLNWPHPTKIPPSFYSPLQLQMQKLIVSFAYNRNISLLFSFWFGLHLLSGFLFTF